MDREQEPEREELERLPRVSGDGPMIGTGRLTSESAAPRERGWTPGRGPGPSSVAGCPA